jgi:hypothetical protein
MWMEVHLLGIDLKAPISAALDIPDITLYATSLPASLRLSTLNSQPSTII